MIRHSMRSLATQVLRTARIWAEVTLGYIFSRGLRGMLGHTIKPLAKMAELKKVSLQESWYAHSHDRHHPEDKGTHRFHANLLIYLVHLLHPLQAHKPRNNDFMSKTCKTSCVDLFGALVAPSTGIYIYILLEGEGAQILSVSWAAREPRNFWKNASYRRKKQTKSCEGAQMKSCEGAPKQGNVKEGSLAAMQNSGLLRSSWNASRRRTGGLGVIFETFSKALPRKVRAPSGLLRSSSRFAERSKFRQNRLFRASVPQKERDSKMCQKSGEITPPIPQKERYFRVATSKKARFRRKNEFSTNLSKLRRKPPKREIAETLEKLGKNDPTEAHVATRDHSTAGWILWSYTFLLGGGVWHLFSFFVRLAPCYFSCLSSSCCWCCLLVFCFFHCLFCLCCFFQVRRTRKRRKTNGRKMRKDEKTKERQKQKKRAKKNTKRKNTSRKKNKGGMKPTFSCLFWGCWPLSGQNPARDKGQTTIWNKGLCCFFLHLLGCFWSKQTSRNNNNKNNKTTKTKQQTKTKQKTDNKQQQQ